MQVRFNNFYNDKECEAEIPGGQDRMSFFEALVHLEVLSAIESRLRSYEHATYESVRKLITVSISAAAIKTTLDTLKARRITTSDSKGRIIHLDPDWRGKNLSTFI